MEDSVRTIKRVGIPVYTVSQGLALDSKLLLERLSEISKATGGVAFTIRNPEEIGEVFSAIVQDLKHLYLLGYYPPATINSNRQGWRRIQVLVPRHKNSQVRAKEGYLP